MTDDEALTVLDRLAKQNRENVVKTATSFYAQCLPTVCKVLQFPHARSDVTES